MYVGIRFSCCCHVFVIQVLTDSRFRSPSPYVCVCGGVLDANIRLLHLHNIFLFMKVCIPFPDKEFMSFLIRTLNAIS